MADQPKRSISDIRPSRSMDGFNRVAKPHPVKAAAKPAPKVVSTPVPETPAATQPVVQAAVPTEVMPVEKYKELPSGKSGLSGWIQAIVALIIIAACAYGIYLIYLRNYR